jgi:hypothetical protein
MKVGHGLKPGIDFASAVFLSQMSLSVETAGLGFHLLITPCAG